MIHAKTVYTVLEVRLSFYARTWAGEKSGDIIGNVIKFGAKYNVLR